MKFHCTTNSTEFITLYPSRYDSFIPSILTVERTMKRGNEDQSRSKNVAAALKPAWLSSSLSMSDVTTFTTTTSMVINRKSTMNVAMLYFSCPGTTLSPSNNNVVMILDTYASILILLFSDRLLDSVYTTHSLSLIREKKRMRGGERERKSDSRSR